MLPTPKPTPGKLIQALITSVTTTHWAHDTKEIHIPRGSELGGE